MVGSVLLGSCSFMHFQTWAYFVWFSWTFTVKYMQSTMVPAWQLSLKLIPNSNSLSCWLFSSLKIDGLLTGWR